MSAALRDSTVAAGLAAAFPVTVTIGNGVTTTSVTAVVANTVQWPGEGSAAHDLLERRDYEIAVSLYAFASVAIVPIEGHTITDADGMIWRVMVAQGSDEPKPWRYINQVKTVYRIQTWRSIQ